MVERIGLWLLALLLCLSTPALCQAQTGKPFRIGVAPHSSARMIIEMYQPLRLSLEQTLQRPVEILTAPDFTEFARRAMAQDDDIAITTGHQARLLQTDASSSPLLVYQADFKAVALISNTSSYTEPKNLSGSCVLGLSPSSLVTLWGRHWLHRHGVSDVSVRYVSQSDSVGQLLIKEECSAGLMSLANYQNLSAPVRDKLRLLAESLPMVGRVYMLNARNRKQLDSLRRDLLTFAATEPAKRYFTQYQLGGYRMLEPRELIAMEPYANEVRLELKKAR